MAGYQHSIDHADGRKGGNILASLAKISFLQTPLHKVCQKPNYHCNVVRASCIPRSKALLILHL